MEQCFQTRAAEVCSALATPAPAQRRTPAGSGRALQMWVHIAAAMPRAEPRQPFHQQELWKIRTFKKITAYRAVLVEKLCSFIIPREIKAYKGNLWLSVLVCVASQCKTINCSRLT